MFDSMLESRTAGVHVRSRWAVPFSILSHLALVGALVGASLLVTVSLKEPASSIIFAAIAPAPPPPPPAPPRGTAATVAPRQVEEPEPEEPLQPVEALDDLPLVEERGSADDAGDEAGVPDGIPGGDPHGVPGGVESGVPGGVPDSPGRAGIDDRPIVVTPDMTPPVLKRRVEPEYPEVARASRLQGRVILQAVISATGGVEEVTVIRSSNPLFEEAATEAVRQWEYEPARLGGRAVAVYFTIDVRFTLR